MTTTVPTLQNLNARTPTLTPNRARTISLYSEPSACADEDYGQVIYFLHFRPLIDRRRYDSDAGSGPDRAAWVHEAI